MWTKNIIKKITKVDWSRVSSEEKIYALYWASKWFAQILRNALIQHPEDDALQQVANEELKTNNLYHEWLWITQPLDHRQYLHHFIKKENFEQKLPKWFEDETNSYVASVLSFSDNRTIIANTENRFEPIIDKILENNELTEKDRFKHFWEQHKDLDTSDWGHGDLLKKHLKETMINP